MRLRTDLGWTQDKLGAHLNVSKRTLSNWECGYWLPPFKQRLHVVLSLRDVPPAHVLEIADALGVSADSAVEPFLKPFRDALYGPEEPEPAAVVVAPPAPPPRPRPSPEALRAALDAVVREAADTMNVPANDLRAAIGRALASSAELGATLEEVQGAVAVRSAKTKAASAP
jgi:transcriptional regulator with XRE-family HTH domain